MSEEQIIHAFEQLHKSHRRSKSARLRELYDHIEGLRQRGYSHATIVEIMKEHGLHFDVKSFEVTFYRIRNERVNAQERCPTVLLQTKNALLAAPIKDNRSTIQIDSHAVPHTNVATVEEMKKSSENFEIDATQFDD